MMVKDAADKLIREIPLIRDKGTSLGVVPSEFRPLKFANGFPFVRLALVFYVLVRVRIGQDRQHKILEQRGAE